jgi:hypothetical protein
MSYASPSPAIGRYATLQGLSLEVVAAATAFVTSVCQFIHR